MPRTYSRTPLEERIWWHIDPTDTCWLWTGQVDRLGYGIFATGRDAEGRRTRIPAHRFVYEMLVGPIPEGHQLHHECESPPCVNPAHLQPQLPRAHRRTHGGDCCRRCGSTEWAYKANRKGEPRAFRYCRPCHLAYLRKRREARR